jgi:hypothetical protein
MENSFISQNIITKGYQLNTSIKITENMLVLNPILEGIGGTTWFVELQNHELIILIFSWGVRPDAIPKLDKKYRMFNGKLDTLIDMDIDVEYLFPSVEEGINESWTQLKGSINKEIEINIKKKFPYWTSVKDDEFITLLSKYNLKISNQVH